MQYIKSWELFESLDGRFQFIDSILDIFLELHDDNLISKCEYIDSGYLFFPEFWSRKIKSDLHFQMISDPHNWEKGKPEELIGGTWKEFFLDTTADEKLLKRKFEYLLFGDINYNSVKIIENIKLGKITAYPVVFFSFGRVDVSAIERFVHVLKRVYRATGFRPIKGFWTEDFVENGEVITKFNAEVQFVKASDSDYKNLVSKLAETGLEKEWLPKLML